MTNTTEFATQFNFILFSVYTTEFRWTKAYMFALFSLVVSMFRLTWPSDMQFAKTYWVWPQAVCSIFTPVEAKYTHCWYVRNSLNGNIGNLLLLPFVPLTTIEPWTVSAANGASGTIGRTNGTSGTTGRSNGANGTIGKMTDQWTVYKPTYCCVCH